LGKDRKPIRNQADNPGVGKWAVTHFEVLRTHPAGLSYLSLKLETGRTHQIRVHLAHLRHPIAGDPLYSEGRANSLRSVQAKVALSRLGRPFLHAASLGFFHPLEGDWREFTAPLPSDLSALLETLRGTD